MKIAIYGMGYVGIVSAACLARDGHEVTGIDPVLSKIEDINLGRSPISEPGVTGMLAEATKNKLLTVSVDPKDGLNSDMIWICVGTPSDSDGSVNTQHVDTCLTQIAEGLKKSTARPLIVLRSTVPPGTTRDIAIKKLESIAGLRINKDIHVCFHPEFLRESSAVKDFDDPPKIVIGESGTGAADKLMKVYKSYEAPRFLLSLEEAEMVKYYDNVFHALKITFANEMGQVAFSHGVDARKIAEVFCADTKLNISKRYLRPGFAFGGSCLPKDLRAINRQALLHNVSTPMLHAMLESNRVQIESFITRILKNNPKKIGVVGLSFKMNTDDLRESPFVEVVKRLIGEGAVVKVFDPGIHPDKLIGSNRESAHQALKHLENLLVQSEEDLNDCDLIVLNHARSSAQQIDSWLKMGIRIIDVADCGYQFSNHALYEGISW